ncbi:MAG: hypothetical protein OXG92_08010 [Chloroflexi bacterium]|nr:hypothetical protein [Chloroflexota bacterium]MCY3581356.1 hypothetical protein [Chloroflexota bacterium]MCY3716393.1 hypothetical protein [Chloroflexota bacterium]MDE2649407.1 hypothetical protein [Chloroflexota bacterium]MXV92142.1 hypothetical protein [Chloroflexota bacterium]
MRVRQATLDDSGKVVRLFTQRVALWQRLNARGEVEDLPYESLTIYERWLHGGAWMSLETGAIWLSHLLGGNGGAYILEHDDDILAYAEVFVNDELTPMGEHLHLADMLVAAGWSDEAHHALAEAILADARAVGRVSVAYPDYDKELAVYFRKYFGTNELMRTRRHEVSAQVGQSFYKSQEFDKYDPALIDGWAMAVGRWGSPRELWEKEWIPHWDSIPQIVRRAKRRHYVNAAGHEALVCFHQQLYNARKADVYCWSPRNLSTQLLVALRDLGHRLGFRSLSLALPEESAQLLPADASAEPNQQVVATVDV